ncbi:hypothetical protein BLNAU_8112 [Blattamonas nauphoetae]|uniref:Uncharacterized protein n=1 Tax=Blattamonas nauphoetae TaxID=2049346 RepID=A0ABQ9XZC6_9EUKA|nr:hypothetical protein BLNAU_8112 [Blattamonas nauphoetae]
MPDIWEGWKYKTIDEDSVIGIVVISDDLGVIILAGFFWNYFWKQSVTPWRLRQQSHGLTITETVGALQGTILQDHNLGGSLLCRNTSFSSCRTSYSSLPDSFSSRVFRRFLKKELAHVPDSYSFTGPSTRRHVFWTQSLKYVSDPPPTFTYATSEQPITFTDCSFTDLMDETEDPFQAGGVAIHVFTPTPLLVTQCHFTNCRSVEGSGGALVVRFAYPTLPGQVRIESSCFKNCSYQSGDGGSICVVPYVRLDLISSTFENCSALSGSGGAACAKSCTVSLSTFKDNKAVIGGALAGVSEISIQFCHFDGNEATTQDPNWSQTYVSDHILQIYGNTFSDSHWTLQTAVLFVQESGEESADCSFSSPCSLLSTAITHVNSVPTEIQLGTGSFDQAIISGGLNLKLSGFFSVDDQAEPFKATSFSIEVSDSSIVSLDTFRLFPKEGQCLVKSSSTAEGAELSLTHLHISGSEISVVPFDFSAGTVSIENSRFVDLSDISCSLVSVSFLAELTIVSTNFINIEIEASVVAVSDGSLSISTSPFRHVTRTKGEGAAAVDCTNAKELEINSTFHHCHSSGVAGAIAITHNDASHIITCILSFLGNSGGDDTNAHDVFYKGFNWADSWDISAFSSMSEEPHAKNDVGESTSFAPWSFFIIMDEKEGLDNEFHGDHVITLSEIETTNFSKAMNSHDTVSFYLNTNHEIVVPFFPFQSHNVPLTFTGSRYDHYPIVTQSNKSEDTLFTLTSESPHETNMMNIRFVLNTKQTTPMFDVDQQSHLKLLECIVTSDGHQSKRSFIKTQGTIYLTSVAIVDISFISHSCIEATAGYIQFMSQNGMSAIVSSLSTTGQGAFLNAQNTVLTFINAQLFECHASDGGVLFLQDCPSVSISGMFVDCVADNRGGAVCVEDTGVQGSTSVELSLFGCVGCHAQFGGAIFVQTSANSSINITPDYGLYIIDRDRSFPLFWGCTAEKGGGLFLDGVFGESTNIDVFADVTINDGPLIPGIDVFITKTLADMIIQNNRTIADYVHFESSLSSRSETEANLFKHVEVEGYPSHSFNVDITRLVVREDDMFYMYTCETSQFFYNCNSLGHMVDMFYPKSDNGFLHVPIFLQNVLYFFCTARITDHSISLRLDDEIMSPGDEIKVMFGDDASDSDSDMIVVDDNGFIELDKLTLDWTVPISLGRLTKQTASMAVSHCTFSVSSAILAPFITCQAGSLVISGSSSFSSTTGTFTFPLVFSASSFLSAKSGIAVELTNISFNSLKMGEGVGVVELNDADHIKLADVDFADVKLLNDSDAVRIVVRGRDLWKTIELVPNSGFPRRGTARIDALFQSLDRNEEGRPFHTPTLLVYLSEFSAPTVHVHSNGKDVLGCGDSHLSCHSLDEADLHLQEGFPSVITVHDSAQLSSQLDIFQDQTKISAKGNECSIHVTPTGSLINHKTGIVEQQCPKRDSLIKRDEYKTIYPCIGGILRRAERETLDVS